MCGYERELVGSKGGIIHLSGGGATDIVTGRFTSQDQCHI